MFCKKKVDDALICRVVHWVLRNINVHESLKVRNNMLINKHINGDRTRVPKLLLECHVREIYNELISPTSEVCLEETKNCVTGEVIISDNVLRNIVEGQIKRMQKYHKIIYECDYCNTSTSMEYSLNACRKTKLKTLTVGL